MILTDTKVTNQAYHHNRLEYDMVCLPEITTDSGGAQGRVVLVVRDRPKGWSVKLMRFHRPNMVICEIISGGKRTPLIATYLPPYTLKHLPA